MGAILLAILFAGVAGYRMLRPSPSAILPVTVPDQPAPTPAADPEPAPAVALPANTSLTAEVPPPPPAGSRASKARRGSAAGRSTEKIIMVDPALAVEEQPLPPPEPKAVETPKPEKLEPAPAEPPVVKEDLAAAPATQSAAADAPKTDSHGKKIGNAFRRLLHLPKKEAQPDTLKQP
jgi:hypothetical protein